MQKIVWILWILFLTAHAGFAIEVDRDSIGSAWEGGDSLRLRNRSPVAVKVKSIHVKRVSGSIGDGLLFRVSNEKKTQLGGFTHWYHLRNSGDSLYVQPASWSENPVIEIPPFDSISIKNILYGTCIFCVSVVAPYNYHVELHFLPDRGEPAIIGLYGNFISGGVRRARLRVAGPVSESDFRLDGRRTRARRK